MEIGLFTEFHWAPGTEEAVAFERAMAEVTAAEALGYDAIWLAELHFQKDRSVLSSPLVVGAAIAARTQRLRIGIGVQILPLAHPLHLAEDVATLDHLSGGRLDLGVGRSGLPAHYTGFNVPEEESRERFHETLEILLKAWTEDRFSHHGRYYEFSDVCVVPKPRQKPHPPILVAATTEGAYPIVGGMGRPIFLAVRTSSIGELATFLPRYHAGWREAGHRGRGAVAVVIPVYVAETDRRAREDCEASALHFYRAVGDALTKGPRREAGERLRTLTYEAALADYCVFGSVAAVTERLLALRATLGYSRLAVWMNVGSMVAPEHVLGSMRLFAERVMPRLRAAA